MDDFITFNYQERDAREAKIRAARNAPEYIARENAVQERLKVLGLEMVHSCTAGCLETEEDPRYYSIMTSDGVEIVYEDLNIGEVESVTELMEKLYKEAARELDGAMIYIDYDNSLFMTEDAPSNDQMDLFCELDEMKLGKQFFQYLEAQKAAA